MPGAAEPSHAFFLSAGKCKLFSENRKESYGFVNFLLTLIITWRRMGLTIEYF